MQEKESVIIVRRELKISSLGITRDAEQLPSWRNFQSAPHNLTDSFILAPVIHADIPVGYARKIDLRQILQ